MKKRIASSKTILQTVSEYANGPILSALEQCTKGPINPENITMSFHPKNCPYSIGFQLFLLVYFQRNLYRLDIAQTMNIVQDKLAQRLFQLKVTNSMTLVDAYRHFYEDSKPGVRAFLEQGLYSGIRIESIMENYAGVNSGPK